MNALLSRISVDPSICFGKPCIRGTRIWVSLILDLLASGETQERILEEYPQLTRDDLRAVLAVSYLRVGTPMSDHSGSRFR
jgi:uncharacterized protein (DUF433 family)